MVNGVLTNGYKIPKNVYSKPDFKTHFFPVYIYLFIVLNEECMDHFYWKFLLHLQTFIILNFAFYFPCYFKQTKHFNIN